MADQLRIHVASLVGIEASIIQAEIAFTGAATAARVSGPPPAASKGVLARLYSALLHLGAHPSRSGLDVTLLPPQLYRETPGLELALALGVLTSMGEMPRDWCRSTLVLGELQFGGHVQGVRGVLPIAEAARAAGITDLLVPSINAAEAHLVSGLSVFPVDNLRDAVEHLSGRSRLTPFVPGPTPMSAAEQPFDMSDVSGCELAKAVLEVAAAGGHSVALVGPPASGKTMLARRLPDLLPPLTDSQRRTLIRIYSVVGLLGSGPLGSMPRPFRAPHHTISEAGLLGGGHLARPGEATLAHHGVLFLDEAQEFRSSAIESLFYWLRRGSIDLGRAGQSLSYPFRPLIVAGITSCPCGYGPDSERCTCAPESIHRYRDRLSPLLARFDLAASCTRSPAPLLRIPRQTSAWYRARILAARERQARRFVQHPEIDCNARIPDELVASLCAVEPAAQDVLQEVIRDEALARSITHRTTRVARTLADLEDRATVRGDDIFLALAYSPAPSMT